MLTPILPDRQYDLELRLAAQRWQRWPVSWPFGVKWTCWRKRGTPLGAAQMVEILRKEGGALYVGFLILD